MNIRYIVIDDEKNNRENLRFLVSQNCPNLQFMGDASSATEGKELIRNVTPDIVFLDIQMPGGSGFDLLRSLPAIAFEVIFVTAYDQFGIQAIKFSALDYLLKPVNTDELKLAVDKAREKIAHKKENGNIANLMAYFQQSMQDPPRIALPTMQETHYVKLSEIIRCEASDNYTSFHLTNGERILVSKTLKEYAELLKTHHFLRTHQSHLVNIRFIKSLLKEDGHSLLLEDKTRVPVSRLHLEAVKTALNNSINF